MRICIEEQNLRTIFRTRTVKDYRRQNISHPRVDEPMEVDMYRPSRKCQLCLKNGHTARYCKCQRGKEINAVNTERNDRDRRCYFCGKPGHIKQFCFEFKRQNKRFKHSSSLNVEAVSGNNKNIFVIGNSDSPNTVQIKIYGNKYRSLVDTGAACSLVHINVYESLQIKPKLSKSNAILKSIKCSWFNFTSFCIRGDENEPYFCCCFWYK